MSSKLTIEDSKIWIEYKLISELGPNMQKCLWEHNPTFHGNKQVINHHNSQKMTVAGLNPGGSSGPDHGDVERTQLVVQLLQQATYAFEGLPTDPTKNGESSQIKK